MKNLKKYLNILFLCGFLFVIVFGLIVARQESQVVAPFTIEQQKQSISEKLKQHTSYDEPFKQELVKNYEQLYNNNYNKVQSLELSDVGQIIEFKQHTPMAKTSTVDSFSSFSFFQNKDINNYNFYTCNISLFSTNFPDGDFDLQILGSNDAIAFLGEEYQVVQDGKPSRYFSVVVAINKNDDISNCQISINGFATDENLKTIKITNEITPDYHNEKITGELKEGDSFKVSLNEQMTLHGTIVDIRYDKTEYGSDSPSGNFKYKGSLARAFVLYSIEGNTSDSILFDNSSVLSMLKPYITSEYRVIGPDIKDLDYKSPITIMPYMPVGDVGNYTTNGMLNLAAEAYISEELWERGDNTVGFDKDVIVHFGDFYINLKAVGIE